MNFKANTHTESCYIMCETLSVCAVFVKLVCLPSYRVSQNKLNDSTVFSSSRGKCTDFIIKIDIVEEEDDQASNACTRKHTDRKRV